MPKGQRVSFEHKFYKTVNEAIEYINSHVEDKEVIDIYDIENIIAETLISKKYTGIYNIFEIVSLEGVTNTEDGGVIANGVDASDKEERAFIITDLSPDNIVQIADKLYEILHKPKAPQETEQ